MAAFVESLIRERRIETAQEILFAGFDRLTPAAEAVIGVLEEREVTVRRQGPGDAIAKGQVAGFEDPDCEMRAAGAWAREILQQNPDHRVGIVCAGLEQQ